MNEYCQIDAFVRTEDTMFGNLRYLYPYFDAEAFQSAELRAVQLVVQNWTNVLDAASATVFCTY